MRLTDLLALSHVPRWSIVRHHRPQSVADHSFRVAVIYMELCDQLGIKCRYGGLRNSLIHDGAESRTGDIPGVTKRVMKRSFGIEDGAWNKFEIDACPWLADEHEMHRDTIANDLVKLADLIETYTFIRMEGYGPHADEVCVYVWEGIERHCAKLADEGSVDRPFGGILNIANVVVKLIIHEAGREPKWR